MPAASSYRAGSTAVGQNDRRETTVFLPIDPRQENCVGAAIYGLGTDRLGKIGTPLAFL